MAGFAYNCCRPSARRKSRVGVPPALRIARLQALYPRRTARRGRRDACPTLRRFREHLALAWHGTREDSAELRWREGDVSGMLRWNFDGYSMELRWIFDGFRPFLPSRPSTRHFRTASTTQPWPGSWPHRVAHAYICRELNARLIPSISPSEEEWAIVFGRGPGSLQAVVTRAAQGSKPIRPQSRRHRPANTPISRPRPKATPRA